MSLNNQAASNLQGYATLIYNKIFFVTFYIFFVIFI